MEFGHLYLRFTTGAPTPKLLFIRCICPGAAIDSACQASFSSLTWWTRSALLPHASLPTPPLLNAFMQIDDGSYKRMDELAIGDRVLSFDASKSEWAI